MGFLMNIFKEFGSEFKIENGALIDYHGRGGEVVVPEGVTSIETAFYRNAKVTSIVIPDSVTFIKERAFYKCYNLKRIVIPDSVQFIDERAFEFCGNLNHVRIPDGISSLGYRTFGDCYSLSDLKIPLSVVKIHGCTFDCRFSYDIDSGIPWIRKLSENSGDFVIIGKVLFRYRGNQKKVIVPDNIVTIAEHAFDPCTPESVVIPDSVTLIEKDAFNSYYRFSPECPILQRIEYHQIAFLLSEKFNYMQALELIDNIRKLLSGSESADVLNYLREHRTDLLFLDSLDIFQRILDSGKIFTKDNIDEFIRYTAENQKHEFQMMLMNYKQEKSWYGTIKAIINNKFKL